MPPKKKQFARRRDHPSRGRSSALPSVPEELDPRQLSPSMGDYGMDDIHMDGVHGYEEEEEGDSDTDPHEDAGTGSFPIDVDEPVTNANGNQTAPRPRRDRSKCWQHFDKITELRNGKLVVVSASCKYCKKILTAGSGGGTGHLNRHYHGCLKRHAMREGGAVQTQLNFNADGTVSTWVYDPAVARSEIARYIATDDQPIGLAQSPNFQRMIKTAFCPQYTGVSRPTTRSDIIKKYTETMETLKQTFTKISFSVALTSDIWLSSHQRLNYISVVAHYIDPNYNLNKRVLALRCIDENHTGEAIASHVLDVIREFGIENRIVSVTLDNASANTRAMEILQPYIQSYIGGYVLHQRCICHIINLIVQAGMSKVSASIDNIRSAIRYLLSSPQVYRNFREYCHLKDLKPRKFGLDMKVRWNSTYFMLKQLKGYESILTTFINAQGAGIVLTEDEWTTATSLRRLLKPFYNATSMLSGIYYPTSPLVIEWLMKFVEVFSEYEYDEVLGPIVVEMREKYLKYFDAIPHLYCFALIFDPRKKLEQLDAALHFIGDKLDLDYSAAFSHVKSEIFRVFAMYQQKYGQPCQRAEPAQTEKRKSTTANMWKKLKAKDTSSQSSQPAKSSWNPNAELLHYLDMDHVSHNPLLQDEEEHVDLLAWWKDNERQFPVLSQFARDVVLVPVSSVSSEATFSSAGRIIEERRSSLTPQMVEVLTCLKDWEAAESRDQHQLENPEIIQAMGDLELDE